MPLLHVKKVTKWSLHVKRIDKTGLCRLQIQGYVPSPNFGDFPNRRLGTCLTRPNPGMLSLQGQGKSLGSCHRIKGVQSVVLGGWSSNGPT